MQKQSVMFRGISEDKCFSRYTQSRINRKHRENERKHKANTATRYVLARIKERTGCFRCGYNRHPLAMDFHHKDGEDKEADVSMIFSLHKLAEELRKCWILCKNCHFEYHAGLFNEDEIDDKFEFLFGVDTVKIYRKLLEHRKGIVKDLARYRQLYGLKC